MKETLGRFMNRQHVTVTFLGGLAAVSALAALVTIGRAATLGMASTIVFTSTRDDPTANPNFAAEIYRMNGDGTNPRRLTENSDGEAFAALSPDGRKIVFNSNRDRAEAPLNPETLYVMNPEGGEQTRLVRGSSGTWSPDSRNIAFHASASGTGEKIKPDPGAATTDSDIFVTNVDDLLLGVEEPKNITNSPDAIDDDPDWSPVGPQIAFTSHPVTDDPLNSVLAEIFVINADGTGLTRLTFNAEEERAPSWSSDGTRIVFMCRRGGSDFELCVMNADGTGQVQLTDNSVLDATPSWSPDDGKIVFHRPVGGRFQLWLMNPDGTDQVQLTDTPGLNLFPSWGEVVVHGPQPKD
jgi:Tol biopolymer transport system component